ncbi:hypothetical protein F7231_07315 [Fibrella aestuarina]|uniref:Lipoprotein n=1 Tax=Fibrivirga algicola TaxID=2950420 RepID=A0ABX0QG73_9BACT|nr:hypothetical protein [Fibrivirga algicola]
MLLVILTSCQRANEKGREVLVVCLEKAKKKASRAMQSGAEAIAGNLTTTRKFSFQACFGKQDRLSVQELDGLLVDITPGFYQRFLTYKADQTQILAFIGTLPTERLDYSSKACVRTDSSEMNKRLAYVEAKFPDVKKQLAFFYTIR